MKTKIYINIELKRTLLDSSNKIKPNESEWVSVVQCTHTQHSPGVAVIVTVFPSSGYEIHLERQPRQRALASWSNIVIIIIQNNNSEQRTAVASTASPATANNNERKSQHAENLIVFLSFVVMRTPYVCLCIQLCIRLVLPVLWTYKLSANKYTYTYTAKKENRIARKKRQRRRRRCRQRGR